MEEDKDLGLLCARILLDMNADVNATDDKGRTPLFIAAAHNNLKMIELLITRGADLEQTDFKGNSAIYLAAWKKQNDSVHLLKKLGCNFNEDDVYDAGRKSDVDLLITMRDNAVDLKCKDIYGYTLFHAAAWEGNISLMEGIVDVIEMDIDARSNGGSTPLHEAVRWERLDSVKFLVRKGANINAVCNGGFTPLDWALDSDAADVVNFLRENGAISMGYH